MFHLDDAMNDVEDASQGSRSKLTSSHLQVRLSLDCKGFYSGTRISSLPDIFCTCRRINTCVAWLERASDQSQSSMFLDFSDSSGVHVCAMALTLWGCTDSGRPLSLSQRVHICIHSSDSGWQTSAPPQTSVHRNSAWDSSGNFRQISSEQCSTFCCSPSVVALV